MPSTATVLGTDIGNALDASARRIADIATNAVGRSPGEQVAALIAEANVLAAIQGAKKEIGEAVAMPKNA